MHIIFTKPKKLNKSLANFIRKIQERQTFIAKKQEKKCLKLQKEESFLKKREERCRQLIKEDLQKFSIKNFPIIKILP